MKTQRFLCLALATATSVYSQGAWNQFNPSGILIDENTDAWHAGRMDDVVTLEPGAGILVATDSGGVWTTSETGGSIALSDSWDKPDMNCLARGVDGPRHFFAGGSGLYETDTTQALPILNWREVPLPNWMSSIARMVVMPAQRQLFVVGYSTVAAGTGVAWSVIPAAGSPASGYVWHSVTGLPRGPYSGIVLGPGGSVVIAASGFDNGRYGIFRGTWNGSQWDFASRNGQITGLTPSTMARTFLAVQEGNRNYMYAACSGGDGAILGILRSIDGGLSWTATAMRYDNEPGLTLHDRSGGQGNDRNGCIGVSPTDSNRVVVGWVNGPFFSVNGGENWSIPLDNSPHRHADMTAIYFDSADQTGRRLFITSDGGVVMSPDFGQTWASGYNRTMANLEFYAATGGRQFPGSLDVSSMFNPNTGGFDTLVAGGTQDNDNVYAVANSGLTPWRRICPNVYGCGDGGIVRFLLNGELIDNHTGEGNDHHFVRRRWNSKSQVFVDLADVDVYALEGVVLNVIENPAWRNGAGELMLAIAVSSSSQTINGLFLNNSRMHWEALTTLNVPPGQRIWAVGPYDGTQIYAAISAGQFYCFTPANGQTAQINLPLPPWAASQPQGTTIGHISTPSPQTVFATLINGSIGNGHGALVRTFDGTTWTVVASGVADEPPWTLAVDTTTTPRGVFVATDDRVSVSYNNGDSWSDISAGLPRRPHCADLRLLTDGGDNSRWLYLSTFGRSVWRKQLVGPHQVLYVNRNYTGTLENGTLANPFKSVIGARDAANPGATLRIFAADYNETPTINKPLALEAYHGPATIGRP